MGFKASRWFLQCAAQALAVTVVGCAGDVPRGSDASQASPAALWSTCDFQAGAQAQYLEPAFVPQSAELRVFAIHEAPAGEAAVHVERGVRTVLVLSAYESTHWVVTADSGLEHVLLDGHHAQTATVPAGVIVENLSGEGALAPCGYGDEGVCRTADLIAGAERTTGLALSGFVGCRYADEFGLYDGE